MGKDGSETDGKSCFVPAVLKFKEGRTVSIAIIIDEMTVQILHRDIEVAVPSKKHILIITHCNAGTMC